MLRLPPQADPGALRLAPAVRPHPIHTPRAMLLLAAADRGGQLDQRAGDMNARDIFLRQYLGGLTA